MKPLDIYLAFRRALRASQLYPENSKPRAEAIERLGELLVQATEASGGGLSMAFLDEGAYIGGEFIDPTAEDDSRPVAVQLFELGIRELRLLPGIEVAEVRMLLEVLTRALQGMLNPVDEDLSILLWESDLRHVGYLLYDREADSVEPELEVAEVLDEDLPIQDYIDDDVPIGSERTASWVTQLTEPERLRLLAQYRYEIDEEIPYKYGRLLVEILRVETDAEEVERTETVARQYLDALLETDRFGALRDLDACIDPEDAGHERAEAALRKIRSWFENPDVFLRAAQLQCDHARDRDAALEFLRKVPDAMLPDLLHLLLDERAQPTDDVLGILREKVRTSRESQELCLRDARKPVRLLALEEIGPLDDRQVRKVRDMLTDPDPELRARAAMALGNTRVEDALTTLSQVLGDPQSSVRVAAARALGRRGGSPALERLLRVIVAKDFVQRGREEQQAFFHSAGQASPREVLPVLARLAEQRGFWPSRERKERAQAALEALSQLGDDAWHFAEDRWGRKRPELVKRLGALRRAASFAGRRKDAA